MHACISVLKYIRKSETVPWCAVVRNPIFFILKNEDFFAYAGVSIRLFSDFSYVEELPGDREYELLPGEQYTFETRLVCRYRGEYEVGVQEVVVTDFLRLFRISYSNPGTIKALVSPRIVSLAELKSLEDFQAVLKREAFAGTEANVIVRDYVEGDSLKRIHWKATAREGKLKVRTRTGEERQGITIFCDMARYSRDRREYLPLENKMLEVLLALAFFFAGRDMSLSVFYGQNGLVGRRVQGMKAFEDFYREVDEVAFGGEEDCRRTLEQLLSGGELWDSRAVFLILHEMDDGRMEVVRRLSEAGLPVVVYAVTDKSQETYMLARAEGIPARYVQGFCVPVEGAGEVAVYSYMAHAWPEAYIPGAGWIPFEPVPGYDGVRYTPWELKRPDAMAEADDPEKSGKIKESSGVKKLTEEEAGPEVDEEAGSGHFWRVVGYMVPVILAGYVLLLVLDNVWGRYRYRRMCPEEKFKLEVTRNLKILVLLGLERGAWETLQELRDRCRVRTVPEEMPGPGELRFIENYENVVYGGWSADEEMAKEAVEERQVLLELLKRERRWAYVRWRVRAYMVRYR